MARKTDLRYIKTEKLIEETYLTLRRRLRRPVKVRELCENAMINKTTFYAHYETMDALHACICEKRSGISLKTAPILIPLFRTRGFS